MRVRLLDQLRGGAIVLMIIDHVVGVGVAFWGWPSWLQLLRYTVTRLALPTFMIIAGYLWAVRGGPRLRRWATIAAAGAVGSFLTWSIGYGAPEIVLQYALVSVGASVVARWPLACVVLGFLQVVNWAAALPHVYEFGYVMAWCGLGVLLAKINNVEQLPAAISSCWLNKVEFLGRFPLVFYLGHLAVLFVIVALG